MMGCQRCALGICDIFVDGGVNFKTIPEFFEICVSHVVCGTSSIVKNDNTIENNMIKINEILKPLAFN